MKKIIVSVFTICAIAALGTACKKSKNNSTEDNLKGTWKLTIEANDDNNNGVMDASEQMADSLDDRMVINSGGTGYTITDGANDGGFTWAVSGSTLKLTDTANMGLTLNLQIENLTSSKMTLSNTFGGMKSWEVFEKR